VTVRQPARARRTALYACYVLAVAIVSVFALGALLAEKTRASAGPGNLTGTWLYDDTREGRVALPRHAATHLDVRQFVFDSYTDARGLRVSARGVETPAQVDVLLVGASYFYGWGVDQPDTLAGVLEANTRLRVANAAVPSGSALGAMRAIEEFADLRPRWVVYDLTDGHSAWTVCPCVQAMPTPLCVPQEYVAFDRDGAAYLHAPIRSVWAPAQGTRRMYETIARDRQLLPGAYWALRAALGNLYRRHVQSCNDDPGQQELGLDYALTRLGAAASAAGAELVVMYIPPLDGDAIGIQSSLQGWLARRSNYFALLDVTEDLVAHRSTGAPEELQLEGDPHPNGAGNRLIARRLCRHIQAQAPDLPALSCEWEVGASAQKSK
jgi:hypothetical protein